MEKSKQNIRIIVTRRRKEYHAQVENDPKIWAAGDNVFSAIGDLIIAHQEYFGVFVTIIPEEKTKSIFERIMTPYPNTNINTLPERSNL